ncbi:type VI secretion system ATPase TssH [Candidatus Manganitrophus noduliformans]|uniref:Type VI secretion system ATPase TssH n=1 Tax=Candidatus Manganitrophus noduliformans TaxID=2606439 RepID=A0A7X6ICE2_9BACT|nr:type VI secretion system ATPase TssH [Candidatus Manganitrophus noduliformans]NKE72400.1 type VI secretion system ATPase TssH [Candidatus Manganitrophus noduliformans]
MIGVDIKSLLRRLNRFSTRSLEAAAGLCVSRSHYEVGVPHLLMQMAEDPAADIQTILRRFGIEPSRLQKTLQRELESLRSGNAGKPVFSPTLLEWVEEAWLIGSIDLGLSEIRSGALLAALIGNPSRYGLDEAVELLEAIRPDELKRKFSEITAGSSEQAADRPQEGGTTGAASRGEETALGRFTIDFTARARSEEIDPVFGRDREIRQMIDILARRRKNNPIVVGEAGVGKTAVVEGLALKVVQGDVPDILKGVDILGLDMGLLQAGAGVKGEFENRLKSVINEVKASPKPIVLFIDEAHTLIGAGGAAGMSDAANLLKPALARGELRTIAATTWSEYKKYFEKDAALARRFQLVSLEEPSEEGAVVILRGLREKYEASHKIPILDDAVVAAAKMSSRYISGRQLPDKAVDLLDTAAARVKIGMTNRPSHLEDTERRIQVLERERGAYHRDMAGGAEIDPVRVQEVDEEIAGLRDELSQLEKRWKEEKEAAELVKSLREKLSAETNASAREPLQKELKAAKEALAKIQGNDPLIKVEVDSDVIAKVISDWTGIPVGKMVQDEARSVLELNGRMINRIKGQDHAIDSIARGIRAAKAGLGNPRAPMGVFLLVGPSGVGKTETALGLADLLFGGERFMVTINMSEFQEKHTVSRLIGSPPGYVGYGEGGILTEAVRQRPYSVVLLDEVEKADPEVLNLFYQVFDKGMLSDGEGRVIDFKNTIILLTSNLATDIIMESCADGNRPAVDDLSGAIRPVLSKHFKPALLARMTVVPYYPIDATAMKGIVELKLRQVGARLMESQRMVLEYDPSVVEQIVQRCTEVETGARNVDHILQGTLLPKISTEILERIGGGPLPDKLRITLDAEGGFRLSFGEYQSDQPLAANS